MNVTTPEDIVQLLQLIVQKKVPSEQMQRLLEGGYLADLLEAGRLPDRRVFQQLLSVGYSPLRIRDLGVDTNRGAMLVRTMIQEGNYNYVDPEILTQGKGAGYLNPTPLAVASMIRPVSPEEAERSVRALRPDFDYAQLEDLLWTVERLCFHNDIPVIAFGSCFIIGNEQKYPCIRYNEQHQKSLELIERSQCMQMIADQVKFLVLAK